MFFASAMGRKKTVESSQLLSPRIAWLRLTEEEPIGDDVDVSPANCLSQWSQDEREDGYCKGEAVEDVS